MLECQILLKFSKFYTWNRQKLHIQYISEINFYIFVKVISHSKTFNSTIQTKNNLMISMIINKKNPSSRYKTFFLF